MAVTHHYPLIKTELIFLSHIHNSGVSPDSVSPNDNGSGSLPAQGEYNIRKGFFSLVLLRLLMFCKIQNYKLHTNHYLHFLNMGNIT